MMRSKLNVSVAFSSMLDPGRAKLAVPSYNTK